MDVIDSLPVLAASVIVLVVAVSGPAISLADPGDGPGCSEDVFPGYGNASVAVTSTPDTAVIEQSRFGAGVYRLQVAPASVNVSDVEGRPTLAYKLRIQSLGHEIGSNTVLSSCTTGPVDLEIPQSTFEPGDVENGTYDGTLYVTYRGTRAGEKVERVIHEENVTVEVDR